jgi:hypothetical protein
MAGLECSGSALHPVDQPHVGLVHLLQEYEGDDGVGTKPAHKNNELYNTDRVSDPH